MDQELRSLGFWLTDPKRCIGNSVILLSQLVGGLSFNQRSENKFIGVGVDI